MDFTFSAEQDQLRATARGFLDSHVPLSSVLERSVEPTGGAARADDDLWPRIVELGWPAILVPQDAGGLGLGLVDLVVVLTETGRLPLPGPFFSSAVLATLAARAMDAPELLGDLATGAARGAVALEEPGHDDPVSRIRTVARRHGADWRLSGTKPMVLDAHTADWVIVVARTPEGLGSFLLEGPEVEPVPMLDPTRQAARLVLHDTPARPLGPAGDHTARWRRVADDAAVGLAAEMIGVCEAALGEATEYAKVRVQFDQPIAAHQVIQHKLVDMLGALELGRVGVHYAAWASDTDQPDRARAAAIAKSVMADAAVRITGDNIQIHGAVGFTWENRAHLLFKRAKQNDVMFGYQGWQRRRIADALLESV